MINFPSNILISGPAPLAHSYRLGLVIWRYQFRIAVGPDICHCGCAYPVLQAVQMPGVYSAAYGTLHYKEPLKSFEIRVGHSPGLGLPSVAILPRLCRERRKAILIIYIYSHFRCHSQIRLMTRELTSHDGCFETSRDRPMIPDRVSCTSVGGSV